MIAKKDKKYFALKPELLPLPFFCTMSLIKRLAIYALGVGIGIVLVYFFFGDRDIQCNYFPNDRVLYDLRKKELRLRDGLSEQIPQLDTIVSAALHYGQIDFEKSEARREPCGLYFIDLETDSLNYSLRLENCDSMAYVQECKSY